MTQILSRLASGTLSAPVWPSLPPTRTTLCLALAFAVLVLIAARSPRWRQARATYRATRDALFTAYPVHDDAWRAAALARARTEYARFVAELAPTLARLRAARSVEELVNALQVALAGPAPMPIDGSPVKGASRLISMGDSPLKAARIPGKVAGSPARLAGSPRRKAIGSPAMVVGSPARVAGSPAKAVSSPVKATASPSKVIGSPLKRLVRAPSTPNTHSSSPPPPAADSLAPTSLSPLTFDSALPPSTDTLPSTSYRPFSTALPFAHADLPSADPSRSETERLVRTHAERQLVHRERELYAAAEELERVEGERDAACAQRDEARTELDAARTELDAARTDLAQTRTERDEALAEVEGAYRDLADLYQDLDDAQADARDLRCALYVSDTQLAMRGEELAGREAELAGREAELAVLRARDGEAELAKRDEQLAARDAELAKLRARVDECRARIEELRARDREQRFLIECYSADLAAAKRRRARAGELEGENRRLEVENRRLEEENRRLEEENERLNTANAALRAEVARWRGDGHDGVVLEHALSTNRSSDSTPETPSSLVRLSMPPQDQLSRKRSGPPSDMAADEREWKRRRGELGECEDGDARRRTEGADRDRAGSAGGELQAGSAVTRDELG
ncbi:hypothetical protein HDZ31DRAFT_77394, partial [Schizophyllum fasciatum]